jgi:2-dehydro-3-deoxygalactonokinase
MSSAIYCDAGTTNTRVWLIDEGERLIAKAQAGVGARDTARDGANLRLLAALKEKIAEVRTKAQPLAPQQVVGTGMLTSPLGLVEVPHVVAPAGLDEIANGMRRVSFPDVVELPILLVPGVRTGPPAYDAASVGACDVMRGEESLVLGLHAGGRLGDEGTLLNLGSHWKFIAWKERRIAASVSLLSGEMIHAAQTQTVLADAVPPAKATFVDPDWCEAGRREQQRSGLMRALFCVRLLQLGSRSQPEDRLSFLLGAFIGEALETLLKLGPNFASSPILISGGGEALAASWERVLAAHSFSPIVLTDEQVEHSVLRGLSALAARHNDRH